MRLAVVCGVSILALVGCAVAPAQLPDGVSVSVYQGRFDRLERQLQLKVSNGSDATITVTAAELDSSRFVAPARWNRPQDIPPGAARDLRVQLGAPDCARDAVRDEIVLNFTLADGTSGTSRLVIDESSTIDAINAEDCLVVAVARLATISPSESLTWRPGAHAPASLSIAVTPTGEAGSVTVTQARSTVLLSLVDASDAPVFSVSQAAVVSAGSDAAVIQLQVIPARCDPHAVAEDKRGTVFPLQVQTSDGHAGSVAIAVSDAVRAELYAFYGDYCGLP